MKDRLLGILDLEEIYRHIVVFGATGCGKTRHVILPLLREALARNSHLPELRAGAIIFDVKGDMAEHVKAVMKSAGRTDEILTIGRNGNTWFDPFASLEKDSRAVTERLMEIVRSLHNNGASINDDFWLENMRRFLQVAGVIARAFGLGDLHGLEGIAKAISAIISVRCGFGDDENDGQYTQALDALNEADQLSLIPSEQTAMAREYLQTDAQQLSPHTWTIITNYAQAYVSCLKDSNLAQILTPNNGPQFFPEDILDQGRLVLVSLSRIHFGPGAEVYRTLIKTAFQQAALQRHCCQFFDGKTVRPINRQRPVLFVADEFPSLLTVGSADDGDAFFLDKCRETKIACILSAQGVSAMSARMNNPYRVNHLLNNCCTKVFMATDCPETLHYFDLAVPSTSEPRFQTMRQRVSAPPAFRLPNYDFASPTQWVDVTQSSSTEPIPKFQSSILRQLETGEVIVLRPQGFAERLKLPPFSPH